MKTKYFFLLSFALLFVQNLFSQDIIYKTDGSEIKAKVIEIDATYIKYKNFEQLEGPLRNIDKSSVFMIKYQDGTEEKFSLISSIKQDTLINFDNNSRNSNDIAFIDLQLQKAQSVRRAGDVLMGISSLALLGVILAKDNKNIGIPFAITFGTTFFTGLALELSGKSKFKYWSKKRAEISFFFDPTLMLNYTKNSQSINLSLLLGAQINF